MPCRRSGVAQLFSFGGAKQTMAMNICSYCGAQYPDDVVECPVDRTRLLEPPATAPAEVIRKPRVRRRPLFGVASVLAPFVGYVLARFVAAGHEGESADHLGGMFKFLGIISLGVWSGALLAIIGLVRREKLWGFALAGLLFPFVLIGLLKLLDLIRLFT